MLMSQRAMYAGAISCPNCGACASAGTVANIAAHSASRLRVDIRRLALFIDTPAGDRIVVIDAAQTPFRSKCPAHRLHHAGVVGGAALQHRWAAVPLPRRAKAHPRLRQDRALQRRRRPTLPAVRRYLDLPDAAI